MGKRLPIAQYTLEQLQRNLVDCVVCRNGMDVMPFMCGQDGRCKVCYGSKLVCLIQCRCGRPLRVDSVGQVDEYIFSCGRDKCKQALQPTEEFAQTIYTYSAARGYPMGRSAWIPDQDDDDNRPIYCAC